MYKHKDTQRHRYQCRPTPGPVQLPTSSSWAALGRVSGFLSSAVFRKSLNSRDLQTQSLREAQKREMPQMPQGLLNLMEVLFLFASDHNPHFAPSMGSTVLNYSDYLYENHQSGQARNEIFLYP